MRCLLSCLWVSSLLSTLAVKSAVWRCLGSAPSQRASSCILVAVSWSPSSIMDFMMRPAAFTIAREGCWNSLNRVRPSPATSSSTMSNFSASVVSLFRWRHLKVLSFCDYYTKYYIRQWHMAINTCMEGKGQRWRSPARHWSRVLHFHVAAKEQYNVKIPSSKSQSILH